MKLLKQLTSPLIENKKGDLMKGLGCGDFDQSTIDSLFKHNNSTKTKQEFSDFIKAQLAKIKAPKFIEYSRKTEGSKDKLLYINVPKNFNWKVHKSLLNSKFVDNVTISQDKLPKCLIDLKTSINSRTIFSKVDLIRKIRDFNNNSFINLLNIYTNNNYRPDLFFDRRFPNRLKINTTSKNFKIEKDADN
uniref:Uncharacterized protein n=1 Tax=Coniophora puteana TaxID=80637 RepID=A0A896Z333_9AGAM